MESLNPELAVFHSRKGLTRPDTVLLTSLEFVKEAVSLKTLIQTLPPLQAITMTPKVTTLVPLTTSSLMGSVILPDFQSACQ